LKNKLLIIVNVDWFFVSHRLPVALEAIDQGYEVHVAVTITNKMEMLRNHGLIVHPINLHRSRTGVFSVFTEFLQILSLIHNVTPDVVHLVTIKPVLLGGIAARLARVPAVVSAVSGLGFVFVKRGGVARLRRYLISLLYRLALGGGIRRLFFRIRMIWFNYQSWRVFLLDDLF